MRFATILAVGLCVAVPAPVAAIASEGVTKEAQAPRSHASGRPRFVSVRDGIGAAVRDRFTTPRPRSDTASAEGYYGRGDAGFSWEPHRWWR